MTPRHEVEWIDINADEATVRRILDGTRHAILPAGESIDDLEGVVLIRAMLRAALAAEDLSVRRFVKTAPVVIDTMDSLDVLPVLRDAAIPLALVHDEYGHFEGIVTPANLMEVIIGAGGTFDDRTSHDEPSAVRLGPDRWSLAGSLAADEMAELLSLALPRDRGYQTAAGFLLAQFQAIPEIGDAIAVHGWRFEVADRDGRRIDRIIATRVVPANRRQKL
jgi:putative hemolysin